MRKKLVMIKLGGSVITDKSKPFTARRDAIRRLGKEIKARLKDKNSDIVIGHGGGSFPHVPASKYQTQKGVIGKRSVKGFCLTADSAIQINRIVIGEFLKLGINAASFAPLSFIYEGKIIFEHIKKAMDVGITPVIYGDVIMDKEKGFKIYSGERTLDILARKLSPYYGKIEIIYYTDTNGVLDGEGKTIPLITPKNFKGVRKFLTQNKNTDVTGGMIHKVEESLKLVKKLDAVIYIKNGLSRGEETKISRT